jgi:hypothetical protein
MGTISKHTLEIWNRSLYRTLINNDLKQYENQKSEISRILQNSEYECDVSQSFLRLFRKILKPNKSCSTAHQNLWLASTYGYTSDTKTKTIINSINIYYVQ